MTRSNSFTLNKLFSILLELSCNFRLLLPVLSLTAWISLWLLGLFYCSGLLCNLLCSGKNVCFLFLFKMIHRFFFFFFSGSCRWLKIFCCNFYISLYQFATYNFAWLFNSPCYSNFRFFYLFFKLI